MRKKKRIIYFIFKFLITIVILYLLFKLMKFDYQEFKTAYNSIKSGWILLSLTGVIMVLTLKSYRWHLLLKRSGILFSPLDSLKSYFSSYAIGIVTPGRLGEFVKAYNVRQKTGASLTPSIRTALSDRLFDMTMLLIFSFSWVIREFIFLWMNNILCITVSITLIGTILILVKLVFVRLKNINRKSNGLFSFIYSCIDDLTKGNSMPLWLISFIAYFFYFLTTWILLRSLSISLSIIDTGYVISIVGLVLLIPLTVAGFGTREASLVYLLSIYGVSAEPAFSFSILQFLVFFVWGGLIGLLFWTLNPVPLEAIRDDSKKFFLRRRRPQ